MDVKKLEKQEAKLRVFVFNRLFFLSLYLNHFKAKIEKRARKDLYEGSKLLNEAKKQVNSEFSRSWKRIFTFIPFLANL